MKGLQSEVQVEGVLRALDAAEVPHQVRTDLGDIGGASEGFGIDESVITFIGFAQAGELVGIVVPREIAAVHDGAAHGRAMTVHILGGGVRHNVGAPFDGTAVDRGREGVVHNEGNAVLVGDTGKFLNIQHIHGGVGQGLSEKEFRVGLERGGNLFLGSILVHESDVDAHFPQGPVDEIEGAAVQAHRAHHMVARLADVEDGEEVGVLAAGKQLGPYAAFQSGEFGGHGVHGRIGQTGIEIARVFQVKQTAHLLAGLILESCTLNNRDLSRLPLAGLVAGLHAQGANIDFLCHNMLKSF